MEVKVRNLGDRPEVVIVHVAGEVDSSSAEQFREKLVSLISEPVRHVIVNLEDLTYINSSGLGALVAGYKRVRVLDGTLRIFQVRGSIGEVMRLIRLDKIIEIYDTEEAALASL